MTAINPGARFGMRLPDGRFFPFEHRDDLLYSAAAQAVLKDHHHQPHRAPRDACRGTQGQLRLFPVLMHQNRPYTVRVENILDTHDPGCPFSPKFDDRVESYSGLVLDGPIRNASSDTPWWLEDERDDVPRSFESFASHSFSAAWMRSLATINPDLPKLRLTRIPLIDEFLASQASFIETTRFANGRTVSELAAERGMVVTHGIIRSPVPAILSQRGPGPGVRFRAEPLYLDGSARAIHLLMDFETIPSICGRARAMNGWHRSPYAFVALGYLEEDCLIVTRIALQPAAILDGQIVLVDSNLEADRAIEAMRIEPFIKSPRLRELNRLIATNWHRDGAPNLVLRYLPDFLFLRNGVLEIEELKGFRNLEKYNELFSGKPDYYQNLRTWFTTRYIGAY